MNSDVKVQAPFEAPVVDHLSVRVIVDSFYERFLHDATHPSVSIEYTRGIPGRQMTTLACEYGLSLHLESMKNGAKAQYLLDFGYTPEVLNRNIDLLNVDPTKINGLVLSHGHRDHYGGLSGFVAQYRTRMPTDLALYVGGEDVFREKWIRAGKDGKMASWGTPDIIGLSAQNVAQVCCGSPHALEGPFTTGYIERQSFENVTGGTMVEDYDHYSEEERRGRLVKDEHPGEHATCYIVKGRGLVVISSCGHSGVINSIKTAMSVANVDKLHAVLGGFHLGLAPPEYIDQTITELEALSPDVVVPMHCTGAPFIEMMRQRMPDRIVTSYVGSRFTFGV
jgi:7,8-dihydropterin-6-yl-methyl-4-(beta-D-ribofuranosyl)aminobenzene 5'-phosphate synthase